MAQQINLYNPIFLKQRKYFSAQTMVQALALIVFGTLLVYVYAVYHAGTMERLAEETEKQALQQREQLTRLGTDLSPQGRSKLLDEEIAKLDKQVKDRRELLASMRSGALGNSEGFSRQFVAFARQAIPGVWLTGFTLGGDSDELSVRGRVLYPDLVPAYIRALSHEDAMRGRRVAELKLVAHEATAQKAGANTGNTPGKADLRQPSRYVEFSLNAPRRLAPPEKEAGKVSVSNPPGGRS